MRTDEMNDLLEKYKQGWYTKLELFPRIACLIIGDNACDILSAVPLELRKDFETWVHEYPKESGVQIGGEAPVVVNRVQVQKLRDLLGRQPEA